MIEQSILDYLTKSKQQGLHRKRSLINPPGKEIQLNFSSNDYLSLTTDERVKQAYQRGFNRYPSGSGGSMVICGYHAIHRDLEQAFSQALNVDDALLFSSGYAANLGVVALLAGLGGQFLIDKALHASFYDGLKLAKAHYIRFLHNTPANLALKLTQTKQPAVVITESIFSMSGQLAFLDQLQQLCKQHAATLLVDEAHAFGVLGREGLGAVVHYGLNQQDIPLRIIPLGKAFGSQGAIVAGRKDWIDALLQFARSHIYSTAISPALVYGLLETLSIIRQSDERRRKLQQLITYFAKAIAASPFKWRTSSTAIQQLHLSCPHKALNCAEFLRTRGIFCQAIRSPTVSKKESGLRVILNYHHQFSDIDYLFAQLQSFYEHTS